MKNMTKRFFRGNLIFLFIVAFMAGIIAKKAMFNTMRIGFDDPRTVIHIGSLYDLDRAEQAVIAEGMSQHENANDVSM